MKTTINKLLMTLLVGGFCSHSLMATETTNEDQSGNILQIRSPYENLPGDPHTLIFENLDLKSVENLRFVSETTRGNVTNFFLSLNRHQFVGIQITDNLLGYLNVFPNLTMLNLGQESNYPEITDAGLSQLNLPKLKHLDLERSSKITTINYPSLTNLNHLKLNHCYAIQLEFGNLPNLTSLHLSGLERGDNDLIFLSSCMNLTSLSLVRWVSITDNALSNMNFMELTHLNLEDCFEITNTGLKNLMNNPKLPAIKCLNVTNCWQITDNGIEEMKIEMQKKNLVIEIIR